MLIKSSSELVIRSIIKKLGNEARFQCMDGYCGACKCKLLKGEIKTITPPTAYLRSDEFLPCISIPVTDIEIEH